MRILFVSIEYPPEPPDGIGSYVAEIGPALVARGHEVHVLSCLAGQASRVAAAVTGVDAQRMRLARDGPDAGLAVRGAALDVEMRKDRVERLPNAKRVVPTGRGPPGEERHHRLLGYALLSTL